MIAGTGLLAGCASFLPKNGQPAAVQTYEHLEQLSVDVAAVDVRVPDRSFERNFPVTFAVSPERALENYFAHRFKASGSRGRVLVMLEDLRVAHSTQGSMHEAEKLLGVGDHDVYTISLRLGVQHILEGGGIPYTSRIEGERVLMVPAFSSIAERESLQQKALENLLQDLDQRLVQIFTVDMGLVQPAYFRQ